MNERALINQAQPLDLATAQHSAYGLSLPRAPKLKSELKGPRRIGTLAGLLFFGVFAGWAAVAPLAGAAVAPGIVHPEGLRFTIQHLEGGIIKTIRVKEGDTVKIGDELVTLDDTADRANLASYISQLDYLTAQEARLESERTMASDVVFPSWLDRVGATKGVKEQELNLFRARRVAMDNDREVLKQRIEQLHAQVNGYKEQLAGVKEQRRLLQQEVDVAEELLNKGLERLPRILALKRSMAETDSRAGGLVANMATSNEKVLELEAQIRSVDIKQRQSVESDLAQVRIKRMAAEEEVRKVRDRLARSSVTSPVNGTVLSVPFRNAGGVVKPGEPIMTIVPTGQQLLINARISPRDITRINVGQESAIIFPSYPQRTMLRINGKVLQVSHDALSDTRTGESYYEAKVSVSREEIAESAPEIQLQPGLPAEVFISTGERTLMEYILQPIWLRIHRSLREH